MAFHIMAQAASKIVKDEHGLSSPAVLFSPPGPPWPRMGAKAQRIINFGLGGPGGVVA